MRLKLAKWVCPDSHMVVERGLEMVTVPRKPTSKMLTAACGAMTRRNRPIKKWVSNRVKHQIRYQAMLKAYEAEQ